MRSTEQSVGIKSGAFDPDIMVIKFKKRGFFMIPQDPVMLLSFINLKLRDYYGSLEQLCDDLEVNEQEIRDKLASIDYHYNEERNQFV